MLGICVIVIFQMNSSVLPASFGLNSGDLEFCHGGLVCARGGLHVMLREVRICVLV